MVSSELQKYLDSREAKIQTLERQNRLLIINLRIAVNALAREGYPETAAHINKTLESIAA